jgi:anaerobic selenocysteine-containing dehydrogenase
MIPSPFIGKALYFDLNWQRTTPLHLTMGARTLEYLHSELRHIHELKKKHPEPFAEIHPETAREYGIANGDRMEVETVIDSLQFQRHLSFPLG